MKLEVTNQRVVRILIFGFAVEAIKNFHLLFTLQFSFSQMPNNKNDDDALTDQQRYAQAAACRLCLLAAQEQRRRWQTRPAFTFSDASDSKTSSVGNKRGWFRNSAKDGEITRRATDTFHLFAADLTRRLCVHLRFSAQGLAFFCVDISNIKAEI